MFDVLKRILFKKKLTVTKKHPYEHKQFAIRKKTPRKFYNINNRGGLVGVAMSLRPITHSTSISGTNVQVICIAPVNELKCLHRLTVCPA